MKVGLVAIFKNEYPYILEWIAYHKNLGVDKFYIADNISNDGSTELLEALDDVEIITRIPFPRVGTQSPQAPAYNYILKKYGHEVDILGFIDADEFIVSEGSLKDNLNNFYQNDEFGAMGLNWSVFGSNNDYFSSEGLILERFTTHSVRDYDNNRHIKTFLKPEYVERMNIHECVLKKGVYCTSTDELLSFDETKSKTNDVNHNKMYINHYVVKSRVEHFINKRRKGSAAGSAGREKGIAYFLSHDKNDETLHFSPEIVDSVKVTINGLKEQIIAKSSFMRLGKGHVDVNVVKNTISGWIVGEETTPNYVKVFIDEKEYKVAVKNKRNDVFNKGISKHLVCGFSFTVNYDLKDKEVAAYIYGSIQNLSVKYLS